MHFGIERSCVIRENTLFVFTGGKGMLLTIIIPVYNLPEYINKCITSVACQVGDNCEILLIDDGSNDGITPRLCDELSNQYANVLNVIHKDNGGVGDARNLGIAKARGEYICFIDGDDYILPNMLDAFRLTIEETHADIIQFGYKMEMDGVVTDDLVESVPHNTVLNIEDYPKFFTMPPTVWNRIWKRSLFVDNDIYFPSKVWYEDMRTVPKLFAVASTVVSLPHSYYVYVQRNGSIMHNDNIERSGEIIYAFEDLIEWFKSRDVFDKYYNILSKMAVFHVLIFGSARVARVDPQNHLLTDFRDFMSENFPDYLRNPILHFWKLPRYYQVVLVLVRLKWYKTLNLLYKLKQRALVYLPQVC